jgi:CO/xanthine dehydrogenase Mo-binding subunit
MGLGVRQVLRGPGPHHLVAHREVAAQRVAALGEQGPRVLRHTDGGGGVGRPARARVDNAVREATGARVTALPLTPERVSRAPRELPRPNA